MIGEVLTDLTVVSGDDFDKTLAGCKLLVKQCKMPVKLCAS